MSERFPEFPTDPTEIPLSLVGEEKIACNKYNTALYYFSDDYDIFNHIYHVRESGQPLYIFNAKRIMKVLKEGGFDMFKSTVEPPQKDQELFFDWAQNKINQEATEYLKDK